MTKKLPRKDFLKLIDNKLNTESLDDLDKMALEGFEYLENDESASESLQRLDQRFDQMMHSQSAPASAETKVRRLWSSRLQRIAAAVLLLMIPAYFLLRAPSDQALFAEHFDVPKSVYFQQTRGTDVGAQDPLQEAFRLYELGSFVEAEQRIGELKSDHPDKPDLIYYQGIAALGGDRLDLAIELLEQSTAITYQNVSNKAPWYLGLAYLKKGNQEKAIEWLQKTVEIDDRHSQQARELIGKLQ